MQAASRLLKEYRALQKEAAEDIILYPKDEGDLLHWRAYIVGPPDTPFEGIASPPLPSFFFDAGCAAAWEAEPFCCSAGGRFELDIVVPKNYPLRPPKIHFITKIFHPNIHFKTGEICLDLLKSAWSAVYTLQSVCRSIIALLSHPEPDSPLNCDCGNLLRSGDVRGYNSLARMYTKLYAHALPPSLTGE